MAEESKALGDRLSDVRLRACLDHLKGWQREPGSWIADCAVALIELIERRADETDGYRAAFYQISELLGLPAMPISPKEAFETVMLPRLRQLIGAVETAGEQPQTRISVTLTAEEFEAMVAREKKLTDELEEADAINGQGVNREVALERANATLVARVNRLRNRIGKAYDALAAAKAEDVQPVETSEPIEHADQCNFWIDGECNCGAADRNAEKTEGSQS